MAWWLTDSDRAGCRRDLDWCRGRVGDFTGINPGITRNSAGLVEGRRCLPADNRAVFLPDVGVRRSATLNHDRHIQSRSGSHALGGRQVGGERQRRASNFKDDSIGIVDFPFPGEGRNIRGAEITRPEVVLK